MRHISISLFAVFMMLSIVTNAQKKKHKSARQSKPNIIYILADDLGIGNVSCYGADNYKTPNIDRLADKGIRFNHAYTAPLCGPSRAMIMTGRYAFRTGATNQDACGLLKPETEIMIPSILKSAGYITSCVGKWGQLALGPKEFGFDDYLKFKGSGVYISTDEKQVRYTVNGKDHVLGKNEYMPDLMHDHLVDFIVKNKNNPFFVYYPMSHVHGEIVPTPDSKPDSKDLFADNISYMDKLVGKLVDVLDSLKLRENTLIIFMGDNGTGNQWVSKSTINGKMLSGKKGEMKECGSLVPMIANWPARFSRPSENNQLIDASDFLPTLSEIAGAEVPKNDTIDGVSFAGTLLGRQNVKQREWIFIELGNKWFVRSLQWKLNRDGELYDMANAPYEEKLITSANQTESSEVARQSLQKVMDNLSPQTGKLDTGSGDGRHGSKAAKKAKAKGGKTDTETE